MELSGGINGYYIAVNYNGRIRYCSSGYLATSSNSGFSATYYEDENENCAVKFIISENTFTLKKCNNNKTLYMNFGEDIFSKDNSGIFFEVGEVFITPVDKNYDLKFVPKDSE